MQQPWVDLEPFARRDTGLRGGTLIAVATDTFIFVSDESLAEGTQVARAAKLVSQTAEAWRDWRAHPGRGGGQFRVLFHESSRVPRWYVRTTFGATAEVVAMELGAAIGEMFEKDPPGDLICMSPPDFRAAGEIHERIDRDVGGWTSGSAIVVDKDGLFLRADAEPVRSIFSRVLRALRL